MEEKLIIIAFQQMLLTGTSIYSFHMTGIPFSVSLEQLASSSVKLGGKPEKMVSMLLASAG